VRLSFVIPAHNEAATIGRCLDAILRELAAVPAEHEIVVVDNASTDETASIAGHYPGVTVIREPRKGITFARQAGLAHSHGDLVANIDADTMLTAGWIATVLREFRADPSLVCLSGPQLYHDAPWLTRCGAHLFYRIAFLTYLAMRFLLRAGSMVQGGNFVCRRAALEAIGGFDTTIQFYGEDTDIARRLHRVGRVKFSLRLPIYASGRRFATEGLFVTGLRYALNYLWVVVRGRPFTRDSRDIRPLARPRA
jgi:cellulose synthase/poly-beta-1,6-N-acetylglucosamine synthase-like glycosyltransferase